MVRAKAWNIDWTGIPMVDPKATPRLRRVTKKNVVYVERGSIRGARFENAHFLLADGIYKTTRYGTKTRVVVECLWHGRKPIVTWMHVTCATPPVEKPNYSGEVVTDFR